MGYWFIHQKKCPDGCVHTSGDGVVGLQDGEFLFYYPSADLPTTENSDILPKHFVIALPDRYKDPKYVDDTDYIACSIVTSDCTHPDVQQIIGSIDEPQFEPYDRTTALYQERANDDGVDWEPLIWTKVSYVGLYKPDTIHRANLHRLRPEEPAFRSRLDTDSYLRFLGLLADIDERPWLQRREDWWSPANPFYAVVKRWRVGRWSLDLPEPTSYTNDSRHSPAYRVSKRTRNRKARNRRRQAKRQAKELDSGVEDNRVDSGIDSGVDGGVESGVESGVDNEMK